MKYVYKNSRNMYYCVNGVESNDLNSAVIFTNFGLYGDYIKIPYYQELRKQKLIQIENKCNDKFDL